MTPSMMASPPAFSVNAAAIVDKSGGTYEENAQREGRVLQRSAAIECTQRHRRTSSGTVAPNCTIAAR